MGNWIRTHPTAWRSGHELCIGTWTELLKLAKSPQSHQLTTWTEVCSERLRGWVGDHPAIHREGRQGNDLSPHFRFIYMQHADRQGEASKAMSTCHLLPVGHSGILIHVGTPLGLSEYLCHNSSRGIDDKRHWDRKGSTLSLPLSGHVVWLDRKSQRMGRAQPTRVGGRITTKQNKNHILGPGITRPPSPPLPPAPSGAHTLGYYEDGDISADGVLALCTI